MRAHTQKHTHTRNTNHKEKNPDTLDYANIRNISSSKHASKRIETQATD